MKFKSLSVGVLTATLLFSGVGPSLSHAQANDNKQLSSSNLVNEMDQLNISEETDVQWTETVLENGEIEYSLTDYEVKEYLRETGQQDLLDKVEKENENVISARAAGVTKVKKNSLGGFDIYLSKLVVQTLAVGGSAAIAFLVSLVPGIGWTAGSIILGAMLAHLSTNIKNGKAFRFNQKFVLTKVWTQ